MPVKKNWTGEENAKLLALRAEGQPWPDVARALRVSRSIAIEQCRRLGLRPVTQIQPPPRPQFERIDRPAAPPGHPMTWQCICSGTSLEGEPYPFPVFS
jgi:hypothetical protein